MPAVSDTDQHLAATATEPAGGATSVSALAGVVDAAWGVLLTRPAGNGHADGYTNGHNNSHRRRKQEDPELRCPAQLRRFRKWSYRPRLPAAVMVAALDSDAEFRAAVADECSEDVCGPEGWLWLTRPDGWEQTLAAARGGVAADPVCAAAETEAERAARRSETVTKRYRRRRAAMRRTERAAVDARRHLEEARTVRIQAAAALEAARTGETGARRRHRLRSDEAGVAAAAEKSARSERDLAAAELRTARAALAAVRTPAPDPAPPAAQSAPVRRRRAAAKKAPPSDLLIVDGYNLAFRLWVPPDGDTAQLRQMRACVERCLTEYAAARRIGVKLVWDGGDEQPTSSAAYRGLGRVGSVEVRFSQNGRRADDVIARICAGRPAARKVIVATDDNELAGRVRRHHASVWPQQKLVKALRDCGILHTGRGGVR